MPYQLQSVRQRFVFGRNFTLVSGFRFLNKTMTIRLPYIFKPKLPSLKYFCSTWSVYEAYFPLQILVIDLSDPAQGSLPES